jgi:transcription elongation factor GreA
VGPGRARYAVLTAWMLKPVSTKVLAMADDHRTASHVQGDPDHAGLRLVQVDYEALLCELDELRATHRADLERRLRDARDFGSPADNDDVLAALEEAAVEGSRISQLEEVVRSAVVIDEPEYDERAGLGCIVDVLDDEGRAAQYRLVGRRGAGAAPNDVSLASPVGKALVGARLGDLLRVLLPSARERTLRVMAVMPPVLHDAPVLVRETKAA